MTRRRPIRLLGAAPEGWPNADRLLLCEGLRRPVRNCEWRVVGWIDRDAPVALAYFAVIHADVAVDSAAVGARATYLHATAEDVARREAALREATRHARKAWHALDAAIAAHPVPVDPRLGAALIRGDCADVEFRAK